MAFNATNENVVIVLLMALTLFMAGVRMRKPLETNWLLVYWLGMTMISFRYPDETFDPRVIMVGLAAGLLLRFEFLGRSITSALRLVEACVWVYILYMGLVTVTTR
jgi:hypothetical protein